MAELGDMMAHYEIETPAPLPMNNINIFEANYSYENEILNNDEYILYIGREKKTKEKKKSNYKGI